jgi:Tfp pilus assembly protein PilO
MGFFEFILILVLLVVVVDAGTKLLVPISSRLADLIAVSVEERRGVRTGEQQRSLPEPVLEELEERLAELEDRLRFLEELKTPRRPPALEAPPDTPDHDGF